MNVFVGEEAYQEVEYLATVSLPYKNSAFLIWRQSNVY